MIEALNFHKWPTDSFPLAGVTMPVSELASRFGAPLQSWWSDGFGPATGFLFRTGRNRVYLVEEREINTLKGVRDFLIHADATDIVSVGQEALIMEVAESLGLDRAAIQTYSNIEDNAANFIADYFPQKKSPTTTPRRL
jgi:hypothetical protein